MTKKNYKLPIFVAIIGIFLIITLSVIYVLTDGNSGNSGKDPSPTPSQAAGRPSPTVSISPSDESLTSMDVIIKGLDTDNAVIVAEERGTGNEYEFYYNGATDFRTSYDRQITAALLKPGDFMRFEFNSDNLIRNARGSSDVKVYKNVLQRTQDDDLRKITVGNEIYRYDDNLLVLNDGYFVGLDTLRNMDVISLYSVDNYLCLIKVESGHGYFKLINHSHFVGGVLKIGRYQAYEITEDLLLTLSEGEYDIEVAYEDFLGQATIRIDRDMTTRLDLGAYAPEIPDTGYCLFEIYPAGSQL